MTTFRAEPVGARVMLIHDDATETRWSEMPVEDAELLVAQMRLAIRQARAVVDVGVLRAPIS